MTAELNAARHDAVLVHGVVVATHGEVYADRAVVDDLVHAAIAEVADDVRSADHGVVEERCTVAELDTAVDRAVVEQVAKP